MQKSHKSNENGEIVESRGKLSFFGNGGNVPIHFWEIEGKLKISVNDYKQVMRNFGG